jgi:hypothetical protein
MLFKVTDRDIREDNDGIDAIPAFRGLNSKQLKYIFLTYDFDTPLKQLSLQERKEQAAENAGYSRENAKRMNKNARDLMNGKVKSVEAAIPVFKSMLRDLDREALEAYDTNLENYMAQMKIKPSTKEEWDINTKVTAQYEKLLIGRKRILENLNLRADFMENEKEEVDEGELSTLDKYMEKNN